MSINMARSIPGAVPLTRTVLKPRVLRHLFGIKDLTGQEFVSLVRSASHFKQVFSHPQRPIDKPRNFLSGRTVAMMFNKLSTRTRVSTEVAVNLMGGHPMFLGKNDIQLGVNETLKDTAMVLSGMTAAIFARVHAHSDILELAEHSKVPVINCLSTDHHPLQTIADFQTLTEALAPNAVSGSTLSLEGKKIAWVGDANNVLFDLASACMMTGMTIDVATPEGYGIPDHMRQVILGCKQATQTPGHLCETNSPEEAVKRADVIVTDTWTSMGQEQETADRLKAFAGFEVTEELARKGGANPDWVFLHCLPRHKEEVSDEVFYGPRSWVFPEAHNRVWAAAAVLNAFVGLRGTIPLMPKMAAVRHGLMQPSLRGPSNTYP